MTRGSPEHDSMTGPRYAIYFLPAPEEPLYRFGCAVLGYDAYGDSGRALPAAISTAADWDALTQQPRQYGFHATLKAPFHLADSTDEVELRHALDAMASERRSIPLIEPEATTLGSFLAVTPKSPSTPLHQLANDCVVGFDRFRAPLSPSARQQRTDKGLSPQQITNLDLWGYPYVFEEFRFHMTLTGPIKANERTKVLLILQRLMAETGADKPIAIDRLVLLRQDSPQSPFRVISHAQLAR